MPCDPYPVIQEKPRQRTEGGKKQFSHSDVCLAIAQIPVGFRRCQVLQSFSLAHVHGLHSCQVRLPRRGADRHEAKRANGIDRSILIRPVWIIDLSSGHRGHKQGKNLHYAHPTDVITFM